MPRREQDPVEQPGRAPGGDSVRYSHPAFGQISANRTQGHAVLYGSDFLHHNTVRIRIARSELERSLSHDWHFPKDELVEVKLSEAQWATFVSSMNIGGGVPCTIRRTEGDWDIPGIPLRRQEDSFKREVGEDARAMLRKIDAAMEAVQSELLGLSKKKQESVMGHLTGLRQMLASNLPYVVKKFAEHMEESVEKAKVEVNAYILSAVHRTGLAALRGDAQREILQLAPGEEESDADSEA